MERTAVLMGDMGMKNANNQSVLVFIFSNLIEICLHILFDMNVKFFF